MIKEEENGNYSLSILKNQLENYGIDISSWGMGKAKRVKDLLSEIQDGSCTLEEDSKGELIRKIYVVDSDIYYYSPQGDTYRLVEDRQEFVNGRVRKRDNIHGVSEKMKPGETPKEGIIRGIQEELGITSDIFPTMIKTNTNTEMSTSFPGLLTEYNRYFFYVVLNDNQFNPNGYVEEQPDKTTYFTWIKIDE